MAYARFLVLLSLDHLIFRLASRIISLYCYLDARGAAEGSLFVDDGLSDAEDRPSHRAIFSLANVKY